MSNPVRAERLKAMWRWFFIFIVVFFLIFIATSQIIILRHIARNQTYINSVEPYNQYVTETTVPTTTVVTTTPVTTSVEPTKAVVTTTIVVPTTEAPKKK